MATSLKCPWATQSQALFGASCRSVTTSQAPSRMCSRAPSQVPSRVGSQSPSRATSPAAERPEPQELSRQTSEKTLHTYGSKGPGHFSPIAGAPLTEAGKLEIWQCAHWHDVRNIEQCYQRGRGPVQKQECSPASVHRSTSSRPVHRPIGNTNAFYYGEGYHVENSNTADRSCRVAFGECSPSSPKLLSRSTSERAINKIESQRAFQMYQCNPAPECAQRRNQGTFSSKSTESSKQDTWTHYNSIGSTDIDEVYHRGRGECSPIKRGPHDPHKPVPGPKVGITRQSRCQPLQEPEWLSDLQRMGISCSRLRTACRRDATEEMKRGQVNAVKAEEMQRMQHCATSPIANARLIAEPPQHHEDPKHSHITLNTTTMEDESGLSTASSQASQGPEAPEAQKCETSSCSTAGTEAQKCETSSCSTAGTEATESGSVGEGEVPWATVIPQEVTKMPARNAKSMRQSMPAWVDSLKDVRIDDRRLRASLTSNASSKNRIVTRPVHLSEATLRSVPGASTHGPKRGKPSCTTASTRSGADLCSTCSMSEPGSPLVARSRRNSFSKQSSQDTGEAPLAELAEAIQKCAVGESAASQ